MPLLDLTPAAHRVLAAVRSAGGRPLVVGGAVRDALLARQPTTTAAESTLRAPRGADVDIEVYDLGTMERVAAALAGTGKVKRQGATFEIVAVTAGSESFDVSLPRGSAPREEARPSGSSPREHLAEQERRAFASRDFTMNALGYDPTTDEVVDHWGGVADLEAGILRHTSAAFADDPLRVLRGVQLAGRFGFTMAPETVTLSRTLADRCSTLPRERIWAEWHKMSQRATFWPQALEVLRLTGWDRHVPELAATQGVLQDPGWHSEGDVWTHLGLAAQAAAEAMDRAEAGRQTGPPRRDVIVLGALVHDLGKVTHSQLRDGRITSYGHAEAGVGPAQAFLARIGAPQHLVDAIGPVVREHMAHVSIGKERPGLATVRRLVRRLDPDGHGATIAEWAAVVDADCAGRGASSRPSPSPAWLEVAEQAGPRPAARLLDGRVLIQHGLRPGPTFRHVLAASLQAQDDGAFTTPEGAAEWFAASRWAQRTDEQPRQEGT